MEKRKINFENYADMHEEKTITGKDGTEITVRDHISYMDKTKFVRELIEESIIIHDDSCVYISDQIDRAKYYMIAKYYTDIETQDVDPIEIVDFMINNEIINEINLIICNDLEFVMDMYWNMYSALVDVYADDNSLSKALRTSFAFLFNGEDITDTLAKAEMTKDQMYNAFKLLRDSEKQSEQNVDNGTIKIGGNIINFAKKTE